MINKNYLVLKGKGNANVYLRKRHSIDSEVAELCTMRMFLEKPTREFFESSDKFYSTFYKVTCDVKLYCFVLIIAQHRNTTKMTVYILVTRVKVPGVALVKWK